MTSPDVAIVKTEKFDVNAMQNILKHEGVTDDIKKQLRAYFKKATNGNQVEVLYQHGKKSRLDEAGRLYPKNGLGLAGMWKDVRNALAAKYHFDVDIVNSQPTLADNIAEKEGLKHEYLHDYINNREERLAELGEDRDENKTRVLAMFYGCRNTEGLSPFWVKCYEDIQRVMKFVFNNTDEADRKRAKKEKPHNVEGSVCALVMQREEEKVLQALDKSLTEQERCLAVLIHDGGLVERLADELSFPPDILQKCEVRIKELTGYEMRLAVKPMNTTLVFPEPKEIVDNYPELKKEFELTHFKIIAPYHFRQIIGTTQQQLSSGDIKDMYTNKTTSDGKKFVPRWLEDPDIKTYKTVGYYPNQALCPPDVFNTFVPFVVTNLAPNTEPVDIEIIKHQMQVLVDFNDSHFQYLLKYIALMFQCPEVKSCICLVFNGAQGTGKDTFWDFIGSKLLGSGSYFNSTDAQNDLFGSFNSFCAGKKLIKMEETACAVLTKNKEVLKTKITQSTGNYHNKNEKMVTLQSYESYVITTNDVVPFLLEHTDRRSVVFTPSSKYIRDSNPLIQEKNDEYWKQLFTAYNDPKVQRAFYDYLMSVDLTGFNVLDKPMSVSTDFVRVSSRPNIAKYMQYRIQALGDTEQMKMPARELWESFNAWNKEQGYHPVTDTKFGMDMREYIEVEAIVKVRSKNGYIYTLYPESIQAHLEKKKWWNDEM